MGSRIPRVLAMCAMVAAVPAFAKRAAPAPVEPIRMDEVEYSIPPGTMGVAVATDLWSGKVLWRKQVYAVQSDPKVEADVQQVFIKNILFSRGILWVTSERGDVYPLDLGTLPVRPEEGSLAVTRG